MYFNSRDSAKPTQLITICDFETEIMWVPTVQGKTTSLHWNKPLSISMEVVFTKAF